MGYTLILQGKLEEGFDFLQEAVRTKNNNKGYSYRNLALYHHKKGNLTEAKKLYDLAFENQDIPIDFLEFHYFELLSELGDKENALLFLEIAKDKGGQMAINTFNRIC